MRASKVVQVSVARDFFRGEIQSLIQRQQISAQAESVDYLTNLMVRYMDSETFFVRKPQGKLENNVLAHLYADYIEGTPERKKVSLQRLGDICLLISGFFADSLKRKIVDVDYYLGMGGRAYWTLSQIHFSEVAPLYKELSLKFKPFSSVLAELSERSGLTNNSDLLRVYERWLLTGSDRLKQLLREHGIATPVTVDPKTKQ